MISVGVSGYSTLHIPCQRASREGAPQTLTERKKQTPPSRPVAASCSVAGRGVGEAVRSVRIDAASADPELLEEAAEIIRAGGLVAFPTETVYGLGANALDADAVARIFNAKGRPSYNPLIAHVAGVADARALTDRLAARRGRCSRPPSGPGRSRWWCPGSAGCRTSSPRGCRAWRCGCRTIRSRRGLHRGGASAGRGSQRQPIHRAIADDGRARDPKGLGDARGSGPRRGSDPGRDRVHGDRRHRRPPCPSPPGHALARAPSNAVVGPVGTGRRRRAATPRAGAGDDRAALLSARRAAHAVGRRRRRRSEEIARRTGSGPAVGAILIGRAALDGEHIRHLPDRSRSCTRAISTPRCTSWTTRAAT